MSCARNKLGRGDLVVLMVRQCGGGWRYLALTREDARWVREDPTAIDVIRPLACLDVDASGYCTWSVPTRCEDTPAGRDAIREHLAREDEYWYEVLGV